MARSMFALAVNDADVRRAMNRSINGLATHVRAEFGAAGELITADMKRRIVAHRKVDTGRLRDAIDWEIEGRRGRLTLRVGPEVGDPDIGIYPTVIERGRRPGSAMPPQGALLPWMARHGIPEEAEFPIRRKIAEEGMQGQPFPFAQPAFQAVGPIAASALTAIGQRLVREWG